MTNDEPRALADGEGGILVLAIGGNALAPPGRRVTIHDQFSHTRESLQVVVDLIRASWRVLIVHGNGPQVGNELKRNELAAQVVEPLPLGVLVASTAGWIGYMIQQSMRNTLEQAGIEREVVTVITQTLVSFDDPLLTDATKPIGAALTRDGVRQLRDRGLPVGTDRTGSSRRLAPSPLPVDVVEWRAVLSLLEQDCVVVAAGGGGPPIYRGKNGRWEGAEAVVDKDRTAAILGSRIKADTLLILTNVPAVFRNWGTNHACRIDRLTVSEAESLLVEEDLGRGSMAPKLEAAVTFLRGGGHRAVIADLADGAAALRGDTGTTIIGDEE